MTIRPIDLNGMIQRTQDVGSVKQQEDAKPIIGQQNIHITEQKEEQRQAEQVQKKSNTEKEEQRYDAKEKGNGQYSQQKKDGRKREHKETSDDESGRVLVKGKPKGFDIKI